MIKKILLSAFLVLFITACSTTPKDTADTSGFGAVTYDSANQLTITFSGGFAGKAYLN